jgi:hypothetical protein
LTEIRLLEKLGADSLFDISLLSDEDKNTLTDVVMHSHCFNAVQTITVPDEEDDEEEEQDKTSASK